METIGSSQASDETRRLREQPRRCHSKYRTVPFRRVPPYSDYSIRYPPNPDPSIHTLYSGGIVRQGSVSGRVPHLKSRERRQT